MRSKGEKRRAPDWTKVLTDAVTTPGVISSAYTRFWNYSVGNQLLAIFECLTRGLEPGPIHTFRGWLELGRHVKKGEKAITLCMPIQVRRREGGRDPQETNNTAAEGNNVDAYQDETVTNFTLKPRWFVLSQTEGDPYTPVELPGWSEARALSSLRIAHVAFTHPDGNCQGYARERQVAVSPVAALPHKTLLHELAHVVLGHTAEGGLDDHDRTPRSLREVEAECVALICCESLNLLGAPECRGYIQHWIDGKSIPDASARRIFKAADAILRAGYPQKTDVHD